MSQDDHGHDPIAEWLDKPRGDKTHRQRFANLARAFLGCADIAEQVRDAGLDPNDIIAHLTGWVSFREDNDASDLKADRQPATIVAAEPGQT